MCDQWWSDPPRTTEQQKEGTVALQWVALTLLMNPFILLVSGYPVTQTAT